MRKLMGTAAAILFAYMRLAGQVNIVGSLHGVITDQQDKSIPLALVELRNTETGAKLSQLSASDGTYSFGRVTPGAYSVAVKKDGFQTSTCDGIVIDVKQRGGGRRSTASRPNCRGRHGGCRG